MKKSPNITDQQLDNLLDLLLGEHPAQSPPPGLSEEEMALYEELLKIKTTAAELGGWKEVDTAAALKEFREKTGLSKPVVPMRKILLYAAATVLPIAIGISGWWYYTRVDSPARHKVALNDANLVRFTLIDGSKISISTQEQITSPDGTILIKDSADTWHYKADNNKAGNAFNTLEIPKNKTFRLTLADGTKIALNAGSTLQYPTGIQKGNSRKVILTGEASFDVVSDPNKPFTVETDQQTITVLGTLFNINAYGQQIRTTVVNGRIAVSLNGSSPHLLTQGEQAVYNKTNGDLNIMKCDPAYALAWRDGQIAFNNASFREVMEQLGHTYNFEVHITTNKYDHLHFNVAPIPRPQNLSTMLDLIQQSTSVNIHFNTDNHKRTVAITE